VHHTRADQIECVADSY